MEDPKETDYLEDPEETDYYDDDYIIERQLRIFNPRSITLQAANFQDGNGRYSGPESVCEYDYVVGSKKLKLRPSSVVIGIDGAYREEGNAKKWCYAIDFGRLSERGSLPQ